eukprot:3766207-Prymnesium_polylepis.1
MYELRCTGDSSRHAPWLRPHARQGWGRRPSSWSGAPAGRWSKGSGCVPAPAGRVTACGYLVRLLGFCRRLDPDSDLNRSEGGRVVCRPKY